MQILCFFKYILFYIFTYLYVYIPIAQKKKRKTQGLHYFVFSLNLAQNKNTLYIS